MPTTHIISSTALSFLFAEKENKGAAFTLKSKRTGKDYTYSLARKQFKGRWYTHLYVEEGYLNFVYLGSYFAGRITKHQQAVETPSAVAISFVLKKVELSQFDVLDAQMELMHMGHCLRCGRVLTDAQSIERGLGPTCAGL